MSQCVCVSQLYVTVCVCVTVVCHSVCVCHSCMSQCVCVSQLYVTVCVCVTVVCHSVCVTVVCCGYVMTCLNNRVSPQSAAVSTTSYYGTTEEPETDPNVSTNIMMT